MQLRIKLVRDMSLTDDQRERLLSMEVTMFEGSQREFLYDGPPTPTMDELEDNDDTNADIPNDQLEWLMNLSDISDADSQEQLDIDTFLAEVLDNDPHDQNNPQDMDDNDPHDQEHNPQDLDDNGSHDQEHNPQDQADSPRDQEVLSPGPLEWSLPVSTQDMPTQEDLKKWDHLSHVEVPSLPSNYYTMPKVSLMIGNSLPAATMPLKTCCGELGEPTICICT